MNTCLIGGNCYAADEVNPENPSERCDPASNMTAWTSVSTTGPSPTTSAPMTSAPTGQFIAT